MPNSEELRMMATSVEMALGAKVDRLDLLYWVIVEILNWRSNLDQHVFIKAWESNLAFLGMEVVVVEKNKRRKGDRRVVGKISGLERDGALRLTTLDGVNIAIHNGEILHQAMI
jgi:biotin-(acetyl-CoA carboxylase) ligase